MSKRNVTLIFILVGSLVCGVGIGYLSKFIITDGKLASIKPEETSKWIIFAGILGSYFFVTVFHELGHLLTGLALGFGFTLFVVGFLGIRKKDDGKIEFYLNKELGYFGGVAGTSPMRHDPKNIDIMSKIILAGPIASLVLCFLCVFLISVLAEPYDFFAMTTGLMSFGIFLATTIPSRTGIFYTDRKRYQRLRSGGVESKIEAAIMEANGLMMSGESLLSMQEESIDVIQQDESVFMRYIGLYYKWKYLMEKKSDGAQEIVSMIKDLGKDMPASMTKWMNTELSKEN